jgi:hypothetical protein
MISNVDPAYAKVFQKEKDKEESAYSKEVNARMSKEAAHEKHIFNKMATDPKFRARAKKYGVDNAE